MFIGCSFFHFPLKNKSAYSSKRIKSDGKEMLDEKKEQ